jgi:hypothetical protein
MNLDRMLHEAVKVDLAIVPVSTASVTSRYFSVAGFRSLLFVVIVGALTAVQTCAVQLKRAMDAAGTSAEAITGALATISNTTANVIAGAVEATITITSAVATNAVVVNGLTFTAVANGSTPDETNREFEVGADDTGTATNLKGILNHAIYGVPGVNASSAAGVVTLKATDPGFATIDVTGVASKFVPAIVSGLALVEVELSDLNESDGTEWTHVGITVTNTGATLTGAVLLRGGGRYGIKQYAGALYADTALTDPS